LKKISGHPTVSTANTGAPKACLTCHTSSGKPAPSLANVLHKPHLTGKAYTKEFDTNCIGCHSVVNGQPGVKGLAASGTSTASTGGTSTGTSG
jgi:mono/diheme cytochrome c family protein